MTEYTRTQSITQPVFSDEAHQRRAEERMDVLMHIFPSLSALQCAYIAASSTDPRMSFETRSMLACFAVLAGPDLKTPVSDDELIEKVSSSYDDALSLMLEMATPAGNA